MSKIVNKIDEYLQLHEDAMAVAKEMHAKKRGKDNDATAPEIEKALEKAGIEVNNKTYSVVANFLDKKGYKVWKKLRKAERYQREQTEMHVCTECGYEKEGPGECPNGHGKLKPAAEEGGPRKSVRDKEEE